MPAPKAATARDRARQREQAGYADGWMGRPMNSLEAHYAIGYVNGRRPCQCTFSDHLYGCRRRTGGQTYCAYCRTEHAAGVKQVAP